MKQLIVILILAFPFLTYSQESYEYLSISQLDSKLAVTQGSNTFEVIDVKDEKEKEWWDFRPIFKQVEQYESKGWEVYASNQYSIGAGNIPIMHFLLRKKK